MGKILNGIKGERFPLIGKQAQKYSVTFDESVDIGTINDDEILWQIYAANEYDKYEKVPFSGQKKGKLTTYTFFQKLLNKNLQLQATYKNETVELHITPQANGEIKIIDVFFLDIEYKIREKDNLKYMNSVNLQIYTLNMLDKYVDFKIFGTLNGTEKELYKSDQPLKIEQKNGIVKTKKSILLSPAMYIQTQQDLSASVHSYRIKVWETDNESNFYEEGLIVKNEMGKMEVPQDSQTPVKTGTSEPVKKQERKITEKINGNYYNFNGVYEGSVTGQKGNENDVYACEGKGSEKDTFVNVKKLKIVHSDFQKVCNIVKHEGLSSEKEEYLYIAHTNYNEAKRIGQTMFQLLNSGYSSVEAKYKEEMKTYENDKISSFARAGVIDALLRDIDKDKQDPTDNATQWDGEDFLAWGIDTDLKPDSRSKYGHNKFDEYGYIKISNTLYNSFKSKIIARRGITLAYGSVHDITCKKGTHTHKSVNGKNKAIYKLPNVDFSKAEYWITGDFYYQNKNKRPFGLEATRVAGYTIFWKKIKI
ncbi:hypothetical protein [Chryseobacterium sp.]|uniref:hypothetical protein n=1 Tax=Chryseobacterium sp. TaxID=1871047 RepID=UPI002899F379|nr:hypothetical protein [Chryseobacterium sp.]